METVVIRQIRARDVTGIRRILESRVLDSATGEILSEEVSDILDRLCRALKGEGSSRFLVAVADTDVVVGMVGMRSLARPMESFARGQRPVEMVHAFVAAECAGEGVGSALVTALEARARRAGHDEILLNSGPRYTATGWGFFDRQPGYERRGVLRDFYGPGQDAPVWAKRL